MLMKAVIIAFMKKQYLPYFLMLLPPLFWAGNFIAGKAVSDQHLPIGLSFWRWFLATLIFTPFALKAMIKEYKTIKKYILNITILSIFGISAFNTLAYISLQYTSATNATLLNSLIPIFILFIASIFFKEKIRKMQILGILLSLVGVLVILSKLNINTIINISFNKGDLWMLLAALDWAVYSLLLKTLRPKELSAISFLGVMMMIGTIFLLPLLYINPLNEPMIEWNKKISYALFYIAIFPSIVSYLIWNYGMQKLGAPTGGQYIHLMPFFGVLMAIIFLGEKIRTFHIIGALFIGFGIWLSIKNSTAKV